MLMFFNQHLKLGTRVLRLNNLVTIIRHPMRNVTKLQLALAGNLQKPADRQLCQLALCQSHWHGAHFAFNINFLDAHSAHLEGYDFVACSGPLNQVMDGCESDAVDEFILL
jgi:hypothetical protein